MFMLMNMGMKKRMEKKSMSMSMLTTLITSAPTLEAFFRPVTLPMIV